MDRSRGIGRSLSVGLHRSRSLGRIRFIVVGGGLLGDLDRVDTIQHADDRVLHRLQHAGIVLVAVATLVDETLEQAAYFADVARLGGREVAVGERGGGALRGRVGKVLVVVTARAAADETRKALVGKLHGDHAQLRVHGIETAVVGADQAAQALVGKLRGEGAEVGVDNVEPRQLPAELTELVADLLDLGLGSAQLVEIGARRDVAEHRVELRLERVEAAAQRLQGVLGAHPGERLLDADGDLGEALVEVVGIHRAAALLGLRRTRHGPGRGTHAQRLLRSLTGSGLRCAARGLRPHGLATVRSIRLAGFIELDEGAGGGRVPRARRVLGAFRSARGAEHDDLVGLHTPHAHVFLGDETHRLGARLGGPHRRVVWHQGAASEIGQALAQSLHLLLDALHVGLELVRNLRSDRPGFVAQRRQPVPHLIEHRRLRRLARTHGHGIGARTIDFVIGLVRHLNPLALVDGPVAGVGVLWLPDGTRKT